VHQDEAMETDIRGHDDMILMKLVEESGGMCSYLSLMKYIMQNYGRFMPGMGGSFSEVQRYGTLRWGKRSHFTSPPLHIF